MTMEFFFWGRTNLSVALSQSITLHHCRVSGCVWSLMDVYELNEAHRKRNSGGCAQVDSQFAKGHVQKHVAS